MQRFYVVWNPAGGAPTVRHDYYSDAMAEARRLARLNPQQEFIVLAAVAVAMVPDPVVVTEYVGPIAIAPVTAAGLSGTDDIPF